MEPELTNFQNEVIAVVRKIPPYGASTYGEVARTIGRPGAARAVGSVLAKNPWHYHACHDEDGCRIDERYVPCHRVVPAGWIESDRSKQLPYLGRTDPASVAMRNQLMDAGK